MRHCRHPSLLSWPLSLGAPVVDGTRSLARNAGRDLGDAEEKTEGKKKVSAWLPPLFPIGALFRMATQTHIDSGALVARWRTLVAESLH